MSQVVYTSDPEQPYAALDLGSNSFHLIVARESNGRLQVIDRHRETVRLAAGLVDSADLSEHCMAQALQCLERIGQRLQDLPSHNVRVVGTNALRKAKNRDAFVSRAENALGHRVEIISGREEARLIYLGVSHSIENRHDTRFVVDIGGGSTELILGKQFQPRITESLHIGCISMSEIWFGDGDITKKSMKRAVEHARQELEAVEQIFRNHSWDIAIGTSGTILAALNSVAGNGEKRMLMEEINELKNSLIEVGHVDRLESIMVSSSRAPVFPGGVAILCAVFESLELDEMHVSTGSLREGVLHDLLGRVHDEDIREKSVQDLIERFHVDRMHGERVAEAALSLFQLVYDEWKLDREDDANLLRWAALLHEVGMDISHASYHKHGAYVLDNLDLPGFSLHEQHQLATLVRFHRRKYPLDVIPSDSKLHRLVLILRLAVVLKRNRSDEQLPPIEMDVRKGCLTVKIDKPWLDHHKLTKLDLDQEDSHLAGCPIPVNFNY